MAGTAEKWQVELRDLERRFAYHAPDAEQIATYQALRANAKELARHIMGVCPQGRERSLALTKLEEAVMWANAAVARGETG